MRVSRRKHKHHAGGGGVTPGGGLYFPGGPRQIRLEDSVGAFRVTAKVKYPTTGRFRMTFTKNIWSVTARLSTSSMVATKIIR